MEEILYRYNPWWEGDYPLDGIFERPALTEKMKNHLASKRIVFLSGLRRIGKTTLLRLFIKKLIEEEKINPRHIFYVSLDDYLFSKKTILDLVEEFRKAHKLSFREKIFLFLDEIGYQENFEQQLKNLCDTQNVKIYASSSSASLLKNKKPFLTGRNIIIEILPLDFQEYLAFKQIKIHKSDEHLKEKYFEEYMETGGLPEYVLHGDMDCLRELVDDIIQKDISAFYNIRHTHILKDFFVLLMERAGKKISINKMAHILNIAPDTASRYLQMFIDTYLIYAISRFGKTNERIMSPKKIYAPDLGIKTLFSGFRDKGSLFENYVYFKIRHKNPCYIYKNDSEIDFFTEDKILIEAKYGGNEMPKKQKDLFIKMRANKKIIVRNFKDVEKLR